MNLKILKWITYKGRRIPITERILKGAHFLSKKEAATIVQELDRRYWSKYGDIDLHFSKFSWKDLGISVRAVDKEFPGVLQGSKLIPIKTSGRKRILGFVVNDTLGRREFQAFSFLKEELLSATSLKELQGIASKYNLGAALPRLTHESLSAFKNYYVTQVEKLKPLITLEISKGKLTQQRIITPRDVIIAFQPTALNRISPLKQRAMWIHEFGHVLTAKLDTSQWKKWTQIYYPNQTKIRSDYGKLNPVEGFAEEFWLFISRGNNSTRELNEYFKNLRKEWNPF